MKLSFTLGPFKAGLFAEKENKKVIIYLPESNMLDTLKKAGKENFNNSEEDKKRLKAYIEKRSTSSFWKDDPGYLFIKKYLPEGEISLIDIGCNVGNLPFYLKAENLWNRISYMGTDLLPVFVELAAEALPEGVFFVSDIQEDVIEESFDVVLTKGTIISTFDPIKSLKNVLSVPSKQTMLIHTAISDEVTSGEKFYNILVTDKDNIYTSSVLSKKAFFEEVKAFGFSVKEMNKRPGKVEVQNKGVYHLYDFVLEKKD
ncbi:class I SAM-dependent methyltransferase [Gracilimonas sp.]|uniref:class I SAM-dependent methyltransferase n=1 Tax=Gracilimonas sp. TaxID=1974203 RepID=UPI0032ED9837